ncbi:MAG: HAD family hydrolase [Candidatus Villigracilaceae bacterium]
MAKILRTNPERNPGAPLALFDLDYTILSGDSEAMWSRFLFEKGVVDKGFLMRITDYYHAYDNGHLDIHEYQAFLLHPLTIHPLSKLHEWRLEYLQQVRQIVRPNIMRRVRRFRTLGFTLLLITASNNFIAEPIAKMLRFPHLICTRIKQVDGRFTNQLEGIPAFQEGKVWRLEQWMEGRGLTLEGSWGYSDSHNDLPLLKRVENPVAVLPDSVLRAYANQHGWKIIDS